MTSEMPVQCSTIIISCEPPLFLPDIRVFVRANGSKTHYMPLTYKLQFKFEVVAYMRAA